MAKRKYAECERCGNLYEHHVNQALCPKCLRKQLEEQKNKEARNRKK